MFGHERLDVYKISLQYVKWVYDIEERLTGKHRHAKDQMLTKLSQKGYSVHEDDIDYDNDYDSDGEVMEAL